MSAASCSRSVTSCSMCNGRGHVHATPRAKPNNQQTVVGGPGSGRGHSRARRADRTCLGPGGGVAGGGGEPENRIQD